MNEMRIDEKEMEKQDNADFEVNADEAGTVPNLLKKKEFRWIRVGRSGYRISRKSFDEWLNHTA